MMSLTFGLFTQVSGLGPLGPLVQSFHAAFDHQKERKGLAPRIVNSFLKKISIVKGGINENGRDAYPKSVSINLNVDRLNERFNWHNHLGL